MTAFMDVLLAGLQPEGTRGAAKVCDLTWATFFGNNPSDLGLMLFNLLIYCSQLSVFALSRNLFVPQRNRRPHPPWNGSRLHQHNGNRTALPQRGERSRDLGRVTSDGLTMRYIYGVLYQLGIHVVIARYCARA